MVHLHKSPPSKAGAQTFFSSPGIFPIEADVTHVHNHEVLYTLVNMGFYFSFIRTTILRENEKRREEGERRREEGGKSNEEGGGKREEKMKSFSVH